MSTQQKIGLTTAIIVGMNAMIGSGIFTIPGALAAQTGPIGILTTVFVAIIAWCLALSLAKVAELFPMEGSFYNYAKQWGGHTVGVLASLSYLIGLFVAMGLLSKMAGIYLHHNIEHVSQFNLGFLTLIVLTILNIMGIVISEVGQYVLIFLTVAPLIFTTILCFTKASLRNIFPFAPYGIASAFQASKTVIFAFFGFESAASLYSIVENPEKNVPKALSYSLLLVGIVYILFAGSIILAVPSTELSDPMLTIPAALARLFPNMGWLITIINISIISAIVGTIHSMIWGSSQLLLSLAKVLDNKFAKFLLRKNILNSRTSVLIVGLCISTSFLLIDKIDLFFSLTSLFIVFAFGTSILTIFKAKNEVKLKDKIIALFGLLMALLIFYFALSGIMSNCCN